MEPITPTTPTALAAHARLAAVRRHRPTDAAAIEAPRPALDVAQAASLADRTARLLRGETDR